MKKLLDLLRNDDLLRRNIYFTAFMTLIYGNITVVYTIIRNIIGGGHILANKQLLYLIIEMDGIFLLLFSFMYFVKEGFFRIRTFVTISVILSLICLVRIGFQGNIYHWLAGITYSSIFIFYISVGLWVIIRTLWEGMQDRVGGEYEKMELNYRQILSYKNISIMMLMLTISMLLQSLLEGTISYSITFSYMIAGIIMLVILFIIRKIIDIGVSKYKNRKKI